MAVSNSMNGLVIDLLSSSSSSSCNLSDSEVRTAKRSRRKCKRSDSVRQSTVSEQELQSRASIPPVAGSDEDHVGLKLSANRAISYPSTSSLNVSPSDTLPNCLSDSVTQSSRRSSLVPAKPPPAASTTVGSLMDTDSRTTGLVLTEASHTSLNAALECRSAQTESTSSKSIHQSPDPQSLYRQANQITGGALDISGISTTSASGLRSSPISTLSANRVGHPSSLKPILPKSKREN
ncbi:unnamed protein product [Protopolystoma xenopodis]|uniref:Uncharacterized protein n=1 Tax=Protopolystoma xenopodis TaxID=117903 RepID=A0A3S5ASM5_9PLAT|nr:unnamed protein product [Protopolystoma xenopodis]